MAEVAAMERTERELSCMPTENEPRNRLEHTPHRLAVEGW